MRYQPRHMSMTVSPAGIKEGEKLRVTGLDGSVSTFVVTDVSEGRYGETVLQLSEVE